MTIPDTEILYNLIHELSRYPNCSKSVRFWSKEHSINLLVGPFVHASFI